MSPRIYGRLLNAVSDYLGLTGSQNVGEVDISSLILTHDVSRALEAGVAQDWFFIAEQVLAANTDYQFFLPDLRSTGNWTNVFTRGQDRQGGGPGVGEVPDDHDILIYDAAVGLPDSDTNVDRNGLGWQVSGNRHLLLYTNNSVGIGAAGNPAMMVNTSGGKTIVKSLPWFLPALRTSAGVPSSLMWFGRATDINQPTIGLTIRALSAPRGILRPVM